MKKSELKALIREVIEELNASVQQDQMEEGWKDKAKAMGAAGLMAGTAALGGYGIHAADQSYKKSEQDFISQISDPKDVEKYIDARKAKDEAWSRQRMNNTLSTNTSNKLGNRRAIYDFSRLKADLTAKYNIEK